jgi:hypothetical protein
MPNSEIDPEIEALAKKIYASHTQAMDLILRYRPDLRAAVVDKIRDQGVFRVLNPGAKKDPIYLLPGSWKVPKNTGGNLVYLELELKNRAVLRGRTRRGVDASWEPLRQNAITQVRQLNWGNALENETAGEWPIYCKVMGPEVRSDLIDAEVILEKTSRVMTWFEEVRNDPGFTKMLEIFAEELRNYSGDGAGSAPAGE